MKPQRIFQHRPPQSVAVLKNLFVIPARERFLFSVCMSLVFLFAVVGTALGEDSCEQEVKIGFQAKTCAFQDYSITLNGAVASGIGTQCISFEQFPNFTNKAWTNLKVDETYQVTAGTALCITHINFDVPEGYVMYIDEIESKTIFQTNGGVIYSGDGSWDVVVRKKCPCEGGGSSEACPSLGSVVWEAGLGNLVDGRSAERISIREKVLSSGIYTPAALIYSPPANTTEVDVVRSGDGSLRQVKAPQAFADVVTLSSSEYELRYYRPADVGAKVEGIYQVTGQPYVTWKIKNPEPANFTKLQILKIAGGVTTDKSEYVLDPAVDSWSLSTGWSAATGNYSRIESRTLSYPTQSSRTETFVARESSGQVVSKIAKTYMTFPWGEELVQEIVDPDGAALTTTYTYYEVPSETHRYRKVKTITNADGSWEKYDYDIYWNISTITRPWKDLSLETATEANSHLTIYGYTNSDNGVYGISAFPRISYDTEQKINGVTVRKTRLNRSIASVDPEPLISTAEASYSGSTNGVPVNLISQTTTTRYHYSASPFLANRVFSVVHPDGRRDSYTYEKGNYVPNADPSLSQFIPDTNGPALRETLVHGTAAAPSGVAFKTTKEVKVQDQHGNQVLEESYVYNGTGYERTSWRVNDYDDRSHFIMSRNHQGEVTTAAWNGEQKTFEIDAGGVETTYTYDSLNRVKTKTKKGIAAGGGFAAQADIVTTFTYDAAGRQTSALVQGGNLSVSTSSAYDKAGRLTRDTDDATELSTTYLYTNGGRTQTITRPGGATEVTDKYLDGQTKTVIGSAVVARAVDYGVNPDGTRWTQNFVGGAGLSSPRWTRTIVDWIDRNVIVERPGFTGTNVLQTSFYNTLGQLQKQTTMAGTTRLIADTLYENDELGRQTRSGLDINGDGVLSLVSTDRLSESDTIFEKVNSDWFSVNSSRAYLTDNNDTPTIQTQRERLNNFPLNGSAQTTSEATLTDIAGNITRTTTTVDRAAKKQTTTTDTPDSNINATGVTVNGLLQSATPQTPQSATTFVYDSLGRQTSTTDPRTGTTTRSYNAKGQLSSTHDGAGTTGYEYYDKAHVNAGRLKSQTNALSKKVYFNYNGRGDIAQTWGDATYPLEYVYDAYGQKTELRTFRGGQNWGASVWPASTTGTADETKWIYQETTGLLTQKQDATLKGPSYTYDELGRMKTRVWARGITSTYGYDANTGELRTVTYSDNTPAVSFTYDRSGRQTNITDAAGAHTRTFNLAGETQTEQITGGILDGVSVDVGYDGFLRRNSLQTASGANTLSSQTYGYDPTSRLETITSGSLTAAYAYHPGSGLLNTTSFTGGTNIARSYDGIGRLQNITTTPSADVTQSYTYNYNDMNQRTRVTREDGSYWSYIYNARGELDSGKKYWSDNSIAWGAQTEYKFDNIGNRKDAKNGGNQLGGLRQSNYTTNSLNQYLQRSVPGAVDVTGTANTDATVTVNNQTTTRKADYYYKELAVDNSVAPAYAQINIVGARNNFGAGGEDAVTEKGGRVFVLQAVETFTYDDDGNLTSDGRWSYTWDAENRLVSMEARASVPVEAKRLMEFSYDYTGRRIQKKVYVWNTGSSSYQLQSTLKFVYEGWILNAELDGANAPVRSYVWGQDISGTLQDAGGIGGLLLINDDGNKYFPSYDGNGNVTTLTKAATGTLSASYEYDAFGNLLRSTGDYAEENCFKFSTKYEDQETGLVYYGYRYYYPAIGRWLSRDPIEESGGTNLYGFVSNNSISYTDILGLAKRYLVGDTLFYTCNCGWVDTGHRRAENAQQLLDKVKAGKGKQSLTKVGFLVEHSQSAGVKRFGIFLGYSVGGEYFVKYNLSPADQESVALGIYKEVSEMMERRQSGRFQDSVTNSGFSGEDLVSNLLGFYRAARGYTKPQILDLCQPLSKEIALKIWDANNGIRKSRSWRPVFYNDFGCCKNGNRWPKQFDAIEEAPKAHLWKWRDWEAGLDHRIGRRYGRW